MFLAAAAAMGILGHRKSTKDSSSLPGRTEFQNVCVLRTSLAVSILKDIYYN